MREKRERGSVIVNFSILLLAGKMSVRKAAGVSLSLSFHNTRARVDIETRE